MTRVCKAAYSNRVHNNSLVDGAKSLYDKAMAKLPPALSSPPKQWHTRVWRLAGPIILANISVPLVGIVDTAVVGHLPDAVYIGAVSIGAVLFSFVFWGFGFLRMSTTGFIAQAWGARDSDSVLATVMRASVLAWVLGVLLVALQAPIAWVGFTLLDASPKLELIARQYFDIRIWSAPATLINYVALGCLIGLQNTRAVLIIQLVLNLTNILLDLVFVLGFQYGVGGVALATIISDYLAAVLSIVLVLHQLRHLPIRWLGWQVLQPIKMRSLLIANADIMLRTLCLIAAFFIFTAQGAKFGELTLAANTILLHLAHLAAYGLDGFAHAAETLVGSAIGARRREVFIDAVKTTTLWALLVALLYSLVYFLLGDVLIALMTDIVEVQEQALVYLPWLIAAPLVSVWSYQLDGIFIGATRTREMRNAMIISLLFYGLILWLSSEQWANHGLWLAFLAFNSIRAISLGIYFFKNQNDFTACK